MLTLMPMMIRHLLSTLILPSLFLGLGLGGPSAAVESSIVPQGDRTLAQTNVASELLGLINQARQQHGLAPLTLSAELITAAQGHADDMAQHNYFSHSGRNGSSLADRVQAAGYAYRAVGENIAAGNRTASAVFEQWMNSPGHRQNMLNGTFTELGVGYVLDASNTTYRHYWVLVLGTR
jgi:uncharacterized protein YkwD